MVRLWLGNLLGGRQSPDAFRFKGSQAALCLAGEQLRSMHLIHYCRQDRTKFSKESEPKSEPEHERTTSKRASQSGADRDTKKMRLENDQRQERIRELKRKV